jgi:hypothetical protein
MANIFKAREIDSNKTGWVCDLSGPDAVNPDCYFFFSTKAKAETFNRLIQSGLTPAQAANVQAAAAALGASRSEAKAAAARRNGLKPKSPRK